MKHKETSISCLSAETYWHYFNSNLFDIFNFNLFCIHLVHRGYDPSDMELVNTENKVTNIMHDVRFNTINFRIYLSRRHSDYNVIAERLYELWCIV